MKTVIFRVGVSGAVVVLFLSAASPVAAVARVPAQAAHALQPLPENVQPNVAGNVNAAPSFIGGPVGATSTAPGPRTDAVSAAPPPTPSAPAGEPTHFMYLWIGLVLAFIVGVFIALRARND